MSFQFFPSCCDPSYGPLCRGGRRPLSILSQLLQGDAAQSAQGGAREPELSVLSQLLPPLRQPSLAEERRAFNSFPVASNMYRCAHRGSTARGAFNSFPVASGARRRAGLPGLVRLSILSQLLPTCTGS